MQLKITSLLRLALAVLLVSSLGFLYGCEKDNLDKSADSGGLDAMRMAFASAGFEKALLQPGHDTAQVYWEPNWKGAYDKKSAKGQKYTFVPLKARLLATRKTAEHKLTMVGVWRFILVKHTQSKDLFYLATYIATPEKIPTQVAIARPFNFAHFNGVLTLQGLSTTDNGRVVYQNGKSVPLPANGGAKQQNGTTGNKTSGNVCENYYTCYWFSGCIEGVVGTMTHGYEGCNEPGWEPCRDWGMSWYQNGYTTTYQCRWVDDPPPPGDDGNGNGGGGDTPTTDPNSPCGQMAILAANPGFQLANMQAIAMTQGQVEYGAAYRNGGNAATDFIPFRGGPSNVGWPRATGWQYDGMLHTHPDGYSVFSMSDLGTMYNVADEGYMHDPATFSMLVYTAYGDDYALKITNYNQFLAFGATISDVESLRAFERGYLLTQPPQYPFVESRSTMNEQSLLRIMRDFNTGLTLLKHDRTTNKWEPRVLGPSDTPVTNPCP